MKKKMTKAAALLLAASMVLSGCGSKQDDKPNPGVSTNLIGVQGKKDETAEEQSEKSKETQKEEENKPHTVIKPDKGDKKTEEDSDDQLVPETDAPLNYDESLVTDAYSLDVHLDTMDCDFHIPQINWDKGDIEKINDMIYQMFVPWVEEVKALEGQKYAYPSSAYIRYEWSVNNDILTLLIYNYMWPDASGYVQPYAINIALRSGKQLSKNDMLVYFNMEEDEYREKVREALGGCYNTRYKDYPQRDAFFNQQYERTIADENVDACEIYQNKNAKLCIIASIYSIAAGDYYPAMIDLSKNEFSSGDPESKWKPFTYEANSGSENSGLSGNSDIGGSTGGAADNGEYILPDSSTKLLTKADIAGLSEYELKMAVNEIYARHGRKFKKEEVRTYFEAKSWYHGTVDADKFDENVLSDIEWKNIKLLKAAQ